MDEQALRHETDEAEVELRKELMAWYGIELAVDGGIVTEEDIKLTGHHSRA